MPLPTGNWDMIGNGFRGRLFIPSVDVNGNLGPGAALTGVDPAAVPPRQILGFWDETAQRITFTVVIDSARPDSNQFHTGYLFDNRLLHNQSTRTWWLTGSFEALAGGGGNAQRSVYGWQATFAEPIVGTSS